jgi:hypothetical protein
MLFISREFFDMMLWNFEYMNLPLFDFIHLGIFEPNPSLELKKKQLGFFPNCSLGKIVRMFRIL